MRIIELQEKLSNLSKKLEKMEGNKIIDNYYSMANYHQLEKSIDKVEDDINKLESYYKHSEEEIKEIIKEIKEEEENKKILREIAPFYFWYRLNNWDNENS